MAAFPNLHNIVSNIHIIDKDVEDEMVWTEAHNCLLTLKQAYNFMHKTSPCAFWSIFPWHRNISPSMTLLNWRFLSNKVPIDDNLIIRGFVFSYLCDLCRPHFEASNNLFFNYSFSHYIISTEISPHNSKTQKTIVFIALRISQHNTTITEALTTYTQVTVSPKSISRVRKLIDNHPK